MSAAATWITNQIASVLPKQVVSAVPGDCVAYEACSSFTPWCSLSLAIYSCHSCNGFSRTCHFLRCSRCR
jgi:hypothetical protein